MEEELHERREPLSEIGAPLEEETLYLLKSLCWNKKCLLNEIRQQIANCMIYESLFPYVDVLPRDLPVTDKTMAALWDVYKLELLESDRYQRKMWKKKMKEMLDRTVKHSLYEFSDIGKEIALLIDDYDEIEKSSFADSDKLISAESHFCDILYKVAYYTGYWTSAKEKGWSAKAGGDMMKAKAKEAKDCIAAIIERLGVKSMDFRGKKELRDAFYEAAKEETAKIDKKYGTSLSENRIQTIAKDILKNK